MPTWGTPLNRKAVKQNLRMLSGGITPVDMMETKSEHSHQFKVSKSGDEDVEIHDID